MVQNQFFSINKYVTTINIFVILFDYQYVRLLNSATVIEVAIAAFRDSDPGSSAGKGGI